MSERIKLTGISYEKLFFGGDIEEEKHKKVTGMVEILVDKDILVSVGTDEEKTTRRQEKAVNFVRDNSEFNVKSVEEIIKVTQDSGETEARREEAEETLDILGKAVLLGAIKGKNEELQDVLGSGDVAGVESALPEAFCGLGKRMVENLIKDDEVLDILERVTLAKEMMGSQDSMMGGVMERAVIDLKEIMDDRLKGKEMERWKEAWRLAAYYTEDLEGLMLQGQENKGIDINALAGAVRDGVKEAIGEKNSPEALWKQKKDFFQAMLLHYSPINMDPFSNMAPEWTANEDKPLLLSLIALSNVSYYKWRYGDANLDVMVDLRGEATFSATNEMMQKMYDLPGVRESMEFFVRDFFDLVSDPKSGVMILRLKGNEEVLERLQNITVTRKEEMKRLQEEGVVMDEMEAMVAVSTAFNLLYSSHVFECGDIKRRMVPCEAYVEQMRAFMHPAMKARAKQIKSGISVGTEEGWGGQLGQWLVGTLERANEKIRRQGKRADKDVDVVFRKKYEKGEVHPFPERLFASFLVMTKVNVVDGLNEEKEVNLAEALHKGWRVNFEKVSKGGNPWGAHADTADSALKLYKACRGDEKSFSLPLGDSKGRSEMIDWAGRVADARNKLSKNDFLSPYVNTAEFVKWTIAACARGGLYPSAELVLMTPNVGENQDISFNALFQSRDLVTREEAKEIKRDFHADGYMSKWERRRIRGLSMKRRRQGL